MRTVLFLACILSAFMFSLGDWQHPHYSFRCLENGAIMLYGLHSGSEIYLDHSSTNGCVNQTRNKNNQPVTIEKNCLKYNATKNFTSISMTVYDPNFDVTTTTQNPTRTPTTPPSYSGGHRYHKFNIICMDIPQNGVSKTVAHVFQETDNHQLPQNYKEVDGVEMRFKAVKKTNAPDISSIYVGDEFYMFLTYMGDTAYSLVPQTCKAIEGGIVPTKDPGESENSVYLWKYGDSTSNCIQHPELLEKFEKQVSNCKQVIATMYGFRFSGNQNYITITCEVTMYPAYMYMGETDVCVKPTRRRKRSIELKTHQVSKTMQVFDSKNSYQSENRSQCNHGGISVWIVALITTTLYRQL
ncbi:uncharacterized protein LOC130046456 [Ostrea edulis]|uniref:uncharacterized protein LOC130046456 n=1 Tax=Ostrea edulis TaxID=37623 RepID=UPI0024AEE6B5|nr:uncharacterized protein LOC130046456 [Ostrea edulis]